MTTVINFRFLLCGMFALVLSQSGFTFEETVPSRPSLPGSPFAVVIIVECYDTFFGKPLGCGDVTHRVVGLKDPATDLANNGGHQHNFDTHPLIAPPPNHRLLFNGLNFDPKLGLSTGPVFGTVAVFHQMPEVAGEIVTETFIRAPRGWFCSGVCFDFFRTRTLFTLDVRLQGIVELVAIDSDAFVFKPRPSTDRHPSAHHGTDVLNNGIRILATAYKTATNGRRPQITDMSLPAGGVFDLCGTYNPEDKCQEASEGGHASHRDGHDVDFSAIDDAGQSINCLLETTDDMVKAFRDVKAGFRQCYGDGHYHMRIP